MFRENLFAGKRILVTGGGTGLGEVMAAAYARLGASVYICGRRAGVAEETAARISRETGARVKGFGCDIRVPESVDELLAKIWTDGGALSGLVNNAAGNFISRTEDLSPRGFNAISDIVFRGTFYVTLACGKRWITERAPASVI
jgi:NAD(P)-dependent dehydrogenase (short-subunit alcohol dehydrogenase family)